MKKSLVRSGKRASEAKAGKLEKKNFGADGVSYSNGGDNGEGDFVSLLLS